MEKLTAEERQEHSIPRDVTLLMTPENFDRVAEFSGDGLASPPDIFVVEFAVAKYKGVVKYIKRDFRIQATVESFTRLVEMAGGIVKSVKPLEAVSG